ncbi:uncharacterized protein CC84DRAFT_1214529 [Paraphaeosphaeria sporulosa]|uniref:Uncharacterized protein n=1 Tax=Paraphaeosphaeria sporulosa TaxID=1460663 RepID=A0A177CKC8_9PLEO|nr:uncharacterized protein CC84DRAFT_1214529 [Paraphaeosphaeria sporulosa]OAG07975.1 hypothetical protein CC84DRAFT_1214529 [Paraphaeosphaeria sporulosa]
MSSPVDYSFDGFLRLLKQENAREILLTLVQSPNFQGLNVAPRLVAPVSQNLTADLNLALATAASTPLVQAQADKNTRDVSQVPGALNLEEMDVPRDDDSRPDIQPLSSPVPQSSTADADSAPFNAASVPPQPLAHVLASTLPQTPANPGPTPLAQAAPTVPTAPRPFSAIDRWEEEQREFRRRQEEAIEMVNDISPPPSPVSSDSSDDVVWDNRENMFVPKYEKDSAKHPLISLDQSFTEGPFRPAIDYELHKMRKEDRAREKAERKIQEKNDRERPIFDWLLMVGRKKESEPEIPNLASIKSFIYETEAVDSFIKEKRKRKDKADIEEAAWKPSMPPYKRRASPPKTSLEAEKRNDNGIADQAGEGQGNKVPENTGKQQVKEPLRGKADVGSQPAENNPSIYMNMTLEHEKNELKRKEMDDGDENESSPQPPKKRLKKVSFAETPTEVRTIPEEEVTVDEDSYPWQESVTTDISPEELYEYSDDELEAADGLMQLSRESTLQDVPSELGNGELSAPQAPQQPWQPPPEVENLRLHEANKAYGFKATNIYPPESDLVKVAPLRTQPYVFGGVREENPLKRKAKGEAGAARPAKVTKTRPWKDKAITEPVRRSRRIQAKVGPFEDDSSSVVDGRGGPESATPTQALNSGFAPAVGACPQPGTTPEGASSNQQSDSPNPNTSSETAGTQQTTEHSEVVQKPDQPMKLSIKLVKAKARVSETAVVQPSTASSITAREKPGKLVLKLKTKTEAASLPPAEAAAEGSSTHHQSGTTAAATVPDLLNSQPTPEPLVTVKRRPGKKYLMVKIKVGGANLERLMRQ